MLIFFMKSKCQWGFLMGNWVGLCVELAQSDVGLGRHCQYFYWNSKGTAQKYETIIVISKQTHVI